MHSLVVVNMTMDVGRPPQWQLPYPACQLFQYKFLVLLLRVFYSFCLWFVRSFVASADIYSETAIKIYMYVYVVPCSVYKAPPDFAFCALLLCPARFVG